MKLGQAVTDDWINIIRESVPIYTTSLSLLLEHRDHDA